MSTVGYERRFNPAIQHAGSEADFVGYILDGQPEPPMYFADMKRLNRDGPPVLGSLPTPQKISVSDAEDLDPNSVTIVDTRGWDAFTSGHLPGSLSFPLGGSFPTDAGSMVGVDDRICLIVNQANLEPTIRQLIRIGCDKIETWCESSEVTGSAEASATITECDIADLKAAIDSGDATVLDVRRLTEFDAGHMPSAANISHTRLRGRMDEVPEGEPIYVSCRSGKRSARASAYLARSGRSVVNVRGGWLAWEKADGAVEK